VLRVLCFESELAENGEAIAVGDRISRSAARVEHPEYGTELDAVEWRFDQDADAAGTGAVTISGTVAAIGAVFVDRVRMGACGWATARGTARLEPVRTTGETRRPDPEVDWLAASEPDADGVSVQAGYPRVDEGDEMFSGWVITLDHAAVEPAGSSVRFPE